MHRYYITMLVRIFKTGIFMGEHTFHPLGARRAIVRGKAAMMMKDMDMEKLMNWVKSRVVLLSTR